MCERPIKAGDNITRKLHMKLTSTIITLSTLLSLPSTIYANQYRVKAEICDSTGEPEMYVTWRIFANDSAKTFIIGDVTGADGKIDKEIAKAGDYLLSLNSMTGAKLLLDFNVSDDTPTADLGTLSLTSDSVTELEEITVTAQKPIIVKEIDRIGYDVQADPEVMSAPLIDILRKVPMVSVDADGNITVNGSSDFKIYKNGRPNNSFTKNAKEIFKAIPASSIKKVEVITDPGAREDAEGVGAILNIVTDSDASINGVMGNISVYGDTKNPVPTPNLWLSSQIGKVTFSLNGGYYNMNRRETENTSHSEGHYLSTGNTLIYDDESSSRRNAYYGGLDLSYEPDTLNLVTVSLNAYQNFGKSDTRRSYRMSDNADQTLYSYTQNSFYPRSQYLDIDGNVNYQRSTRLKGENLTLSYQVSTTGQKQRQQTDYYDLYNPPFDYSGISSDFDLRFIEHTFQFDWTRPVAKKHTLDVGAKYILRRNHSKNFREYIDTERSTYDDFNHNTDIGALYADFRARFGKLNARAGFRYEYSRLAAKFKQGTGTDFSSDINDYVPNVSMSYNLDDANTLKLAFNRRISRPGISYLDPTVASSPNSTSSGNPHLHSASYNSIQFNYSLIKPKFNLDLSLVYRFSNDMIAQTMDIVNDHIYYSYGNVGHSRKFSFTAYFQWTPTNKTTLYGNISYQFERQTMPDGSRLSRPTYNPWLSVNQKLPWHMRLTGNVGWWSGGIYNSYTYGRPGIAYFWNNFRVQKFFLKDDRLSLGVGLSNPFGPYKRKDLIVTSTPDYYSETQSCYAHNFAVTFSVSFRFGSMKASVKKTAASIENDDLQGRKN